MSHKIKNQRSLTISCWNCGFLMKQFAHDTFYWFYKCQKCGKEKVVERTDRKTMEADK